MSFRAFNYGANCVAYKKNNHLYGMTCAWAMQVDYDKVLLLLGAQSVTGKNISKKDLIGVSALAFDQQVLATRFGEGHSDIEYKFTDVDFEQKDSAIIINGASRKMVVEVIDILKPEGIKEDNLIYGKIKEFYEEDKPFLDYKVFE